jgi:tetratricopeptide (TPR) repeat protein
VQLNPEADIWLDMSEFEALIAETDSASLQSAVDLYRGPFLDGFYHDWVIEARYRLDIMYCETLTRLMFTLEAKEDYNRVLGLGLKLLDQDPLREDAYQLTMRALCHLGQRNAALEQYQRCLKFLEGELGVKPMVETTELYRSILDGSFQPNAITYMPDAEKVVLDHRSASGQDPLDTLVKEPLVGREEEIACLQDYYKQVRDGKGGLLLIRGEAGVGKTRLIREFTEKLAWGGATVLLGHCYEFERILPYQPIAELLRSALSMLQPENLDIFPSWVLNELAHLIPEISDQIRVQKSPQKSSPEEKNLLFESVVRILIRISSAAPLIVIFEDIHWATESTLQMIHYLVRQLENHPVLIAGILRTESGDAQLSICSIERQLRRQGLAQSISLEGLSEDAVIEFVMDMSGCAEAVAPLARRLYQETEGNPFYLIEIIEALFEEGLVRLESGEWKGDFIHVSKAELPLPHGVSDAIQARAQRLDQDVQQALQVAVVLGREFDFELLKAAWEKDEEKTLEALDTLLRSRFIDEGSGSMGRDYAFHHHKIQEVLYNEIPLRHRQHLHARIGKAMETIYTPDDESVAGEIAFHYQNATELDQRYASEAIHYLLKAGDLARLAYALDEAIAYYQQALILQKEIGEYQQAARTQMRLGLSFHTNFDFAQARLAYDEGFSLWQLAGKNEPKQITPAPHPLRLLWGEPSTLDPGLCRTSSPSQVSDKLF